MGIIYVTEQGTRLSIQKRRLLIQKSGELIAKVPLIHARAILLFGNISITTPALRRLLGYGVDIVFLSQHGDYEGRIIGPHSRFGELRHFQYEIARVEAKCLPIAQQIVQSKIRNMQTILMRYHRRTEEPIHTDAFERLHNLQQQALRTTRLTSLMGVEGQASAVYFQTWRHYFKHDWAFEARRRRPPTDPVNVLLSFGYTLLTRAVESMVSTVGLDPYLGVLHRISYGRPSLALDMVEEFRHIVVDGVVMRVLNNEIVTAADFRPPTPDDTRGWPLVLGDAGRKAFLKAYEDRMATKIKHPITGQQLNYRQTIEMQVRLLARTFRDGQPYIPFEVK